MAHTIHDVGGDERLWCDVCGAEHEVWASRCAVCDGALATHRPERVDIDHSVSEVDVTALDLDERAALQLLLRVEDVPHEFDRSVLRVPVGCTEKAQRMVADVLAPFDPGQEPPGALEGEADAATASRHDSTSEPRLASLGWRVLARIVDEVLFGVIVVAFSALWWYLWREDPPRIDRQLRSGVLWLLVEIALVARFGWDLGKVVLGLRVVDADRRPPGWRRAVVRSAVLWGPPMAVMFAAGAIRAVDDSIATAVAVLSNLWLVAIMWSIGRDSQRRGWHDRAAGTWVLR